MSSPSIFPLPLSLFEYYMMLDDQCGNTMTLPLSFRFRGRLDREALEAAYDEARERHPLFLCTVDPEKSVWKPVEEHPGIEWLDGVPTPFPWTEQRIDVTKTPGLRLAVLEEGETTTLYFLFHHVVADGLGFFRFFDTLLLCYLRARGQDVALKEYPPEELRRRENFNLAPPPSPVPWYRMLFDTFRETLNWLIRNPVSLRSRSEVASDRPLFTDDIVRSVGGHEIAIRSIRWNRSGFLFADLPKEASRKILDRCKERGMTVGSVLLGGMFQSLAESTALGFARKDKLREGVGLMRIGIPCNMRGPDTGRISACNMVSYAFPTRRSDHCHGDAFYRGIAEELYVIKNWHIGMMFLAGLSAFRKVPFLLRRLMQSRRCLATAMLSSMNRLETLFSDALPRDAEGRIVLENAILEEIRTSVPYRASTRLSATTGTYAGRMLFSLQYDASHIDPADAVTWLEDWLSLLLDSHYCASEKKM